MNPNCLYCCHVKSSECKQNSKFTFKKCPGEYKITVEDITTRVQAPTL